MELIEKSNPAESRMSRLMNSRITRANQDRERAIRIDTKITGAVERHSQLIFSMKERVATHNRKVMEVLGSRANSAGNEKKEKFEAKVAAAEERREQLQKKSLDRVVNHNKKVMELKKPEAPAAAPSLSDKLQANQERHDQLMKKNLERVAGHNRKVMERRIAVSVDTTEDKRQKLEIRL